MVSGSRPRASASSAWSLKKSASSSTHSTMLVIWVSWGVGVLSAVGDEVGEQPVELGGVLDLGPVTAAVDEDEA